MILPPFQGPRLKIARAQKHIADLKSSITAFNDRVKIGFFTTGAQSNDMTEHRLVFSELPPNELQAIFGDAVHNLRACLDLLVNDVAEIRGRARKLYFRFGADETELLARLKKDKLDKVGKDVWDAVVGLKPWSGGNDNLRSLHDMDISDKHKAFVPYFMVAHLRHSGLGFYFSKVIGSTVSVKTGTSPADIFERTTNESTPFIPNGLPGGDTPMVEALQCWLDLVTDIVDDFEKRFST